MVLTINNTDYKIHYGYKVVAKYGISKKVTDLQETINNISNVSENIEVISDILNQMAEIVCIGLDSEDVTVEDTMDLLETYFSENKDNDDVSVLGLFGEIINELVNNDFLAKMFPKEIQQIAQETAQKQTAKKTTKKKN
jgi:hypothetical protein